MLPTRVRGAVPRALAVLLAAAMLAGGCGANQSPSASSSSATSPSASAGPGGSTAPAGSSPVSPPGDVAAVYRTIEEQVRAIRGLEPKEPVEPQILDEEGLKAYVARTFHEDNPPEIVAANERLYKGLGLLPADASLEDLYLELLGSQIAGLYSPDEKALYVISRSGDLGPTEKVTFAHEYTHALQDQTFGLAGLAIDEVGQGDRALGRLGLIEGDATLLMTFWLQQQLSPQEITQMITEASDPEQLAQLARMPAILREPLTWPYSTGMQFVLGLQAAGGWEAVDAAFEKPPASTEQVIHPEKYAAGEIPDRVAMPADLASAMGPGWSVGLEDTLGELQLQIWLREALGRGRDAGEEATGWGGDRVAILDGPDEAWGIALVSEWDTPADADAFAAAADQGLPRLERPGSVAHQPGTTRVAVVLGSDPDAALALDRIFGHTGS